VEILSNDKEFEKASKRVIDMLVDTTLKKHNVKLKTDHIDEETKKELRKLVKDLQKSVKSLKQNNENNNDK